MIIRSTRFPIAPERIKARPYLARGWPFLSFHRNPIMNAVNNSIRERRKNFPPGKDNGTRKGDEH